MEYVPGEGIVVRPEGGTVRVFFDFGEVSRPEGEDCEAMPGDLRACRVVDVRRPATYGALVSAIVGDRYGADEVQALVANHAEAMDPDSAVGDAKRAEYLAEWAEFQAWRAEAKRVAALVVDRLSKQP